MHLTQIDTINETKLNKLNQYLNDNFKISINADSGIDDLQSLRESTIAEIQDLRYDHGHTAKDADLAKSLAILEAVDVIINMKRTLAENAEKYGPYHQIIDKMSDAVSRAVNQGDDLDTAITVAMREYRSSKYRYPDFEVEQDVRSSTGAKLIGTQNGHEVDEDMLKALGCEAPVEEGGDFYHPDTEFGSTQVPAATKRKKATDVKPNFSGGRGTKATFAPRDGGRTSMDSNQKSRLMMSEDGGEYIYLADEPKLVYNPNSSKGNCVANVGFESNGEEISYPVRVRFAYDQAAGVVTIDSIADGEGQATGTELGEAERAELGINILDELMAKGI